MNGSWDPAYSLAFGLRRGSPVCFPAYSFCFVLHGICGGFPVPWALVSTIRNRVLKSVWKLIVLLSPCQSYFNWGLHKVKNIAEEPLFQHLLAVLKSKEWPCTVSIFLKVYILVQLQAFKNCALSFFQLVLRSQKFNSKMAQAFSFPLLSDTIH